MQLQPHSPATSTCAAAAPRTPPPQHQPGTTPGLSTKNQAHCCQTKSRTSCKPSCDRSPRHMAHGLSGDLHPGTRWEGKRLSGAVGGARLVMDHGTVGRFLLTRTVGLAKHSIVPSAATGALLGGGFCCTNHFQLFPAVAEHTKQLGFRKSSAASRAQVYSFFHQHFWHYNMHRTSSAWSALFTVVQVRVGVHPAGIEPLSLR